MKIIEFIYSGKNIYYDSSEKKEKYCEKYIFLLFQKLLGNVLWYDLEVANDPKLIFVNYNDKKFKKKPRAIWCEG